MAKKLDLDFYSKSLFAEVSKVLGDEFSRLPERIQTGYVKVFEYHSGIIRHNQLNCLFKKKFCIIQLIFFY